ncbi:MAG: pyridoxine 5'-phosphate synthase [Lewinellaceae bacterium]|nr:pyridoxine 5'-phosphate synthase [Lewinellaceae bacterium]HQU51920.1 pyridoxine 5'-phosphate synthase [Saprospiraceae bacterium]
MTHLSVNLNKVALIRNSRGENLPDLVQVAKDCEAYGAQGITIHPRPDQRHARYADVSALKEVVTTELNVEGNPIPKFMEVVLQYRPHQCTLVPDAPDALTSSTGWNTIKHASFLRDICIQLREAGIRSSIFVDPIPELVEGARHAGADRIEFYTGHFARQYHADPAKAVHDHVHCARLAAELGLEINAGHDLNLDNLHYYVTEVPQVAEVSIGHALISDALYYGLENTIQMYLHCLDM